MFRRIHVIPGYGWGWSKGSGELIDVPAPFELLAEPIEEGSPVLIGHFETDATHILNGFWVVLKPRHSPPDEHYNLAASLARPAKVSVLQVDEGGSEVNGYARVAPTGVDSPAPSSDNRPS